ncbi:MAG: glycerophosphodiester phosphodiesterase family protein [Candidatus Fimenecus sp.]
MKRVWIRKLLCCLAVLAIICSLIVPVFAEDASVSAAYTALKNPAGDLIAVSKYGDTEKFPEQSVEGLLAASEAGADMVYVTVRKTADGYIVLMADENLSRMCVDALGNVVDKNIADVGYHELSEYHLRNSTGSLHEKITAYTVPTLVDAAKALSGKALLLVEGGWAFRDEIYDALSAENLLNSVVLLADGDKKEVKNWISEKPTMPLVLSSYHGNVVFSAKSVASKTLSGGAVGTLLSSFNPYGVVYGNSVLKEFTGKGRAAIDMTDPALCGKREDNAIGWNDVTARGYSIIITNNITELCEYRARVSLQKERLSAALEAAQNVDVTLCSTQSANALKDAIAAGKEALVSPASENSLMQANYSLRTAVEGLTNQTAEGEKNGTSVTPGKVIAVILVVAALILLEVILETARRKKNQKRKQQRARRAQNTSDSQNRPNP